MGAIAAIVLGCGQSGDGDGGASLVAEEKRGPPENVYGRERRVEVSIE